jgi:CHAT domain-containing protein
VVKRLSCESAITVVFDVTELQRVSGDWKPQITLKFSESASVSMQIVAAKDSAQLLVLELDGSKEPKSLRNFQISDQLTGRWEFEFLLGHIIVRHDGREIGEAAVGPSDQPIEHVLIASVRGNTRLGRLKINCQTPPPPPTREQESQLSRASELSAVAQEHARYSRYGEAAKAMSETVTIYERVLGPSAFRTTWARGAIGSYLTHLGRLAEARPILEKSLSDFSRSLGDGHPYTASAQLMLANFLIGINDAQQGLPLAERALETVRRNYGGDSPTLAAALSTYSAGLAVLGDYEGAAEALSMAVKVREAYFGSEDPHSLRYIVRLAELQVRSDRRNEARETLHNALRILSGTNTGDFDEELRVRRALATIDLDAEDYPAAADAFTSLLAKVRTQFGGSHRNVALILRDLSLVMLAQGRLDEGRQAINEAANIQLEAALDVIGASSEVEALGFMREVFGVQDLMLSVDLADERVSAADTYRRVAPLRGIYTRVQLLTSGGQTHSLPAEGQDALRELRDVQSMLSGFATYAGPMQNDRRIFSVLDVVTKQKEVLQRKLAAIANSGNHRPDRSQSAFDRLSTFLPPCTAVVDLFKVRVWRAQPGNTRKLTQGWEYLAFILSKTSNGDVAQEILRLGSAEHIDKEVIEWKRLVSTGAPTPAQASDRLAASGRLLELVWKPLLSRSNGAMQIVVIPDGAFAAFPWAALQTPTSGRYIIEDGYAVATALSSAHVAQLLSTKRQPAPGVALLVGDVNYGRGRATETRAIFVGGVNILQSGKWGALSGSKREIDAIRRMRPNGSKTVILRGKAANERATESAMRDARYIHFATHGYFDAEPLLPDEDDQAIPGVAPNSGFRVRSSRNPLLRSGLVLAGANETGRFEKGTVRIADGILTAEELTWLDLSGAEMVVLSACETALGSVVRGEGAFGLERAFLLAGARTVVDGLWKVDDATTATLMTKFYESLWTRNLSKIAALREAQLQILNRGAVVSSESRVKRPASISGTPSRTEPYYWAAFTLAGDWR